MIALSINGSVHELEVEPGTPLLWVLRETLGLTGAKYGCGIAACGPCTVLVDGSPVRSCVTPVSNVAGKAIVTIEGLSPDRSDPVRQAWIAQDVPQCGFCQSGRDKSLQPSQLPFSRPPVNPCVACPLGCEV